MRVLRYISIFGLLIALALYLRGTFSDYQEFGGQIFNTYYKVKIRTPLPDKNLPDKIKATLQQVDSQMSAFRADSELSRINQAPAGQKIELSKDMAKVMRRAKQVHLESQGAFDPAIAPLIDLWGFGPSHQYQEPNRKKLAATLSYSKFSKIRLAADSQSLTKADSRTELNLSAIAKGYAVDKVAEVLEEAGFRDYIVEIGGEVRLSGRRDADGSLWSIGIGVPLKDSHANAFALELSDYAVATSGDYRNFIEQDGKVFSHTISPQTGRPVKNDLASVTVFAKQCADADAYATVIMAMGAKAGLKFADRLNLPVIAFVHQEEGGFKMLTSSRAKDLIGAEYEAD